MCAVRRRIAALSGRRQGSIQHGPDSESVDELDISRNDLCNLLYKRIREEVAAAQSEEEDSEEMSTVDEESEAGEYDEEEDSGNESRHEVSSLLVAASRRKAARIKKMRN